MKALGRKHVVDAQNVIDGTIAINFQNETSGGGALVQVRDAAGAIKAWDGVLSLANSGSVTVDNSGAVDWADTDVITVIAF